MMSPFVQECEAWEGPLNSVLVRVDRNAKLIVQTALLTQGGVTKAAR